MNRCDTCNYGAMVADYSGYRVCRLAEGDMSLPVHDDPPFYADGNDGYRSWLYVKPDHYCAAWEPRANE